MQCGSRGYALKTFQLERVAVVDFDAHNDDGTQAAFFNRPELFYASSHQSLSYPGTALHRKLAWLTASSTYCGRAGAVLSCSGSTSNPVCCKAIRSI
ncbi:hypothetical protein [Caballeronia sp. 15715]|uniref:hypothetical protein n=1 Tax=unclassified Caballeronia TaxID=2646786 RepID=UPI0039E5E0AF